MVTEAPGLAAPPILAFRCTEYYCMYVLVMPTEGIAISLFSDKIDNNDFALHIYNA